MPELTPECYDFQVFPERDVQKSKVEVAMKLSRNTLRCDYVLFYHLKRETSISS